MKGIRLTELMASIRANIVAFFSISMFVCLGVGLFLGIGWGAEALRRAADDTYTTGSLHDIEVQFPYGITQDDLAKLKKIDGVTTVEQGYSGFVTMKDGNTSHILKLQSMPSSMDASISIKGNLPMEPNEVALLAFWADDQGIVVGDTITLNHDATSADDEDGMEYLNADELLVTALVDSPAYAYKVSGSLGVSNIGSGAIDCVGFVTEDAFDADKFHDGYTNVYIRCAALEGVSTFSDEYREGIAPIVDEITELGGTLGSARYEELHGEAQDQVDDAQKQIDEGEQQLADAQRQIDEGEQQIAEGKEKLEAGQQELVDGLQTGSAQQAAALQKLQDAYRQLTESQAKYDAGVEQYNTASDLYNQAASKFDSVRSSYDRLVSLYNSLRGKQSGLEGSLGNLSSAISGLDSGQSSMDDVENAYDDVQDAYDGVQGDYDSMASAANTVGNTLGIPVSLGSLPQLSGNISQGNASALRDLAGGSLDSLRDSLDTLAGASLTIEGVTVTLLDVPSGLQRIYDKLADSKAQLESAKAQLDAGWAQYYAAKAAYDEGVADAQAQLAEGEQEIRDGKETLEQKEKELAEGKETLDQKTAELQDGKAQLEDGKAQLDAMVEYEWIVMPRQDNGGVQGVKMIADMMDSVKWAMASLFILVGLFVCYSSISRLVHEEIVQIGTKKALGFREGEIASLYLWFSGLAVAIGIVASVALAVFLVQGIMNPTASRQFSIPAYAPYVGLPDVLVVGGIELALILASTWMAIHGLLKREALDLLRGETAAGGKERFYERTRLWQNMSLFSQTVVNNCVNDKRRVAGTLIGVVGCTALIVTAVTLSSNVANSLTRHYDEVYGYDSVAYLSSEDAEAADEVAMALYQRGVASAPAFMQQLQVRQSDGTRSVAKLVVPTNEDAFKKFYHVVSTSGDEANVEDGGLWVSAAFGEHMGVKVGDEVVLTENTGKTHTFTIAGFFDYYLLRQEFVLSQMQYREAFGTKPEPNVVLVSRDGADMSRTRDALTDIEGYESLADDYQNASYAYDEMNSILTTVVLIYLALSALMALMVLMNLDIMFVSEKKKELITLMICGFSVKEAKAYIYRDSIVLTVVGIFLGVLLGAVMGGITVWALEPFSGYFLKGFNWVAAAVGVVGAGVFATAVLLWSLRAIPRFDLTDINRF